MKPLALALIAASLVACTSVDPYSGEQKTSNTAKGAGIGAVLGAVVGVATASKDDRAKGALTGAAAGGAIGGGAGYYMDRQEAALRQSLQSTGVQVRREGDTIRLIMPGNITFASGSSDIRGDFYNTLNGVGTVLAKFDETAIRIAGHTDSTGGQDLNQRLSESRADSVKRYLVSRGVAGGRIHTNGYGSRYPVASNDTAAGREANRRVELELIPLNK